MTEEEPTEPYATVEQMGRWTYHVTVHDGGMEFIPAYVVLGHKRAQRKAEKVLLRYVETQRRRAAVERVRLADG